MHFSNRVLIQHASCSLFSYSGTRIDEDAEWCCMETSCVTELDLRACTFTDLYIVKPVF